MSPLALPAHHRYIRIPDFLSPLPENWSFPNSCLCLWPALKYGAGVVQHVYRTEKNGAERTQFPLCCCLSLPGYRPGIVWISSQKQTGDISRPFTIASILSAFSFSFSSQTDRVGIPFPNGRDSVVFRRWNYHISGFSYHLALPGSPPFLSHHPVKDRTQFYHLLLWEFLLGIGPDNKYGVYLFPFKSRHCGP